MNRNTIKLILNSKFNSWVKSITDEKVRKLVEANSIITGGCIVSMFLNEEINDFDIYFTDIETVEAVANYYVDQFKKENSGWNNISVKNENGRITTFIPSSGFAKAKGTPPKGKFKPMAMSSSAITLSDKIQLITRFYGDAEEIHSNYDFVHCTNYWTPCDRQLHTNADALEAILSKTLTYTGSKYPICSMIRTRKFIKRGWHINGGQYLKMAFQVNELDLKDTNVLQDQLTGVDAAYFHSLIRALEKLQEKEERFEISTDIIVKLVDRIFG